VGVFLIIQQEVPETFNRVKKEENEEREDVKLMKITKDTRQQRKKVDWCNPLVFSTEHCACVVFHHTQQTKLLFLPQTTFNKITTSKINGKSFINKQMKTKEE
jgi:hypothetical protein